MLQIAVLYTFGPRDWWEAWYELFSPTGYVAVSLTSTQQLTFSAGSLLIFRARFNANKINNGDWRVKFVTAFVDPWAHGGSEAIIDYRAEISGSLRGTGCYANQYTAGPFFRFKFNAADQEADITDEASGTPCGVPSQVDIAYSWSGRTPAERAPWKETRFETTWGYAYYNRGTITATVLISLSYGYIPPPQPPTPTPTPTPTPEPCWVCVPAGPPPIWWGFDLSPPECFVLLPSFGWSEKDIFGVHIPGLQIPEVQVCVRWLSIEGEFLGLSFEMLFAGIAALSAIAILLSILGGI